MESEEPELPDTGTALCQQAELASHRINRRPMVGTPRQNPKSHNLRIAISACLSPLLIYTM